jgi:hypothetical protein
MESPKHPLALFCLTILGATASGTDPVPQQVFKGALRSIAYVKSSTDADMVRVTVGVIIDREKRLVLVQDPGEAKSIRVVFPIFDKDGAFVNDPKPYAKAVEGDKAGVGKLFYRDETRHLALIQLDKELPDGVAALPMAGEDPRIGSQVWRVGAVDDSSALWGVKETPIRFSGWSILKFEKGKDAAAGIKIVVPAGISEKTDAVLLNRAGKLCGFGIPTADQTPGEPGGGTIFLLRFQFTTVSEVQAFLASHKIKPKEAEPPLKR